MLYKSNCVQQTSANTGIGHSCDYDFFFVVDPSIDQMNAGTHSIMEKSMVDGMAMS